MKKNNKVLFYVLAVVSSLCLLCAVAAIAMQAGDTSPGIKTASDYMDEFGGNPDVYARILAMTDCAALQNEFDQAEANLQQPGTPQYRWGLGYMKASDDRMKEIGCYETRQMPIEQVIANTAASAQTQTMAFVQNTQTLTAPVTLAPSFTPIPTDTPFLYVATQPSADGGGICSCAGDTLNCSNFQTQASAQACFNHCISQGAGDIHKLDQNNDGNACESLP